MILAAWLAVTVLFDYLTFKIPNRWIAAGAAVFTCLRLQQGGSVLSVLAGLALPFLICLPLFLLSMIGAADVKLLMILGIWTGPAGILQVMVMALAGAGILSLVKLLLFQMGPGRLAFFLDYVRDLLRSGQSRPYIQAQDLKERKPWLIHLSVPIALAMLVRLFCLQA